MSAPPIVPTDPDEAAAYWAAEMAAFQAYADEHPEEFPNVIYVPPLPDEEQE
jgi:hypothetical protein